MIFLILAGEIECRSLPCRVLLRTARSMARQGVSMGRDGSRERMVLKELVAKFESLFFYFFVSECGGGERDESQEKWVCDFSNRDWRSVALPECFKLHIGPAPIRRSERRSSGERRPHYYTSIRFCWLVYRCIWRGPILKRGRCSIST